MDVNDHNRHPSAERLNAYVERALDGGEHGGVEAHLAACARCREEVAELRSVFAALSDLPRFAPSVGFGDRVMAGVRVRRPVTVTAGEWVERLTPQSTQGWAAAAAVLALPVLGATLLVAWVMAQPGVTPQGLWTVATQFTGEALSSGWHWAWTRFAETAMAGYLIRAASVLESVGRGEIGLAVVMFATFTAGSIYVLYQNLFRTQERRSENASYVF
jgi:hypothetical protein